MWTVDWRVSMLKLDSQIIAGWLHFKVDVLRRNCKCVHSLMKRRVNPVHLMQQHLLLGCLVMHVTQGLYMSYSLKWVIITTHDTNTDIHSAALFETTATISMNQSNKCGAIIKKKQQHKLQMYKMLKCTPSPFIRVACRLSNCVHGAIWQTANQRRRSGQKAVTSPGADVRKSAAASVPGATNQRLPTSSRSANRGPPRRGSSGGL